MGRIPDELLEQIAAASDIVEIIGGYFPLKRAGAVYKALCPFHQERTPSFTVNPQRQIFKCFGCGAGGGVFQFVTQYENVDFPTAVKRLAERAGIRIVEEQLSAEDDRRLRMRRRVLALHAEAAAWFHRNLMKTPGAQAARDYLKKRGLTVEVAKSWQIGYAPEAWDDFGDWAHSRGYSAEEIIRSGLVKVKAEKEPNIADAQSEIGRVPFYDRFRDRVMFPICNDLGEVIAFSGRVLSSDPQAAKYVNSPETMLFTKGKVLFGLHKAKRALIDASSAIVCEGQIDLITAFESGVKNVIAPQGTAFTDNQARILKRYVEEVVLCFDSDVAGQKAAEKSLPWLLGAGLSVRVATMPEGHDPDSLIREEGPAAFVEQIENASDFFDFQIEVEADKAEFATPRGKMQFARKMAGFVSLITDNVLREAVVFKVTTRLGLAPAEFRRLLETPKPDGREKETAAQRVATQPLSAVVSRLCQLSLQSAGARSWMQGQPWRELVAQIPDGALLETLLEGELAVDDPAAVNGFLAHLSSEDQAQLSGILALSPMPEPERTAQTCWLGLQRDLLIKKREALQAALRSPGLEMERTFELQKALPGIIKEILDLQKRITDIARPFP
jgi:DNA primase